MCTLYERIQELCKAKGVSASRMCLDLGLSKSTMSDIKNGRKKGVSTGTAQKIASYFNVSVGYLLGEAQKENPLDKTEPTERDQRILEAFYAKTLEEQRALLTLLGVSED